MSRPGRRDSSSHPEGQPMTNQTDNSDNQQTENAPTEERRASKRIAEIINETPSKFHKMYVQIESDDESSSASDAEVPSQTHTQLAIDGEFSPAFKDCFLNLAACVKHPQDILSLKNASPRFKEILPDTRKNSALWSRVLPILLDNEALNKNVTLACRLGNKEVNTVVDAALTNIQPTWISDAFSFEDADAIEAFLDQVHGISSPFLSAYVKVHASDATCLERALQLLTLYGHHLYHFDFGLNFLQTADLLQLRLVQVLTLIPNVKSLYIGITRCRERRLEIVPVPPSLHALTTLKVYRLPEAVRERVIFPREFFHLLLQIHGQQLTRFSCDHFLFESIPFNQLEIPFENLRHLEISREYLPPFGTEYRMLSNIPDLRIESLYLSGQENIPYNRHTILALNHVRNTLSELRMDSLAPFLYGMETFDPRILNQLPKLKRLTVGASALNSALWHVFRHQFGNMEHLCFQRLEIGLMPSPPDADLRETFFWSFPKLVTITWENEDGNTQVFTR